MISDFRLASSNSFVSTHYLGVLTSMFLRYTSVFRLSIFFTNFFHLFWTVFTLNCKSIQLKYKSVKAIVHSVRKTPFAEYCQGTVTDIAHSVSFTLSLTKKACHGKFLSDIFLLLITSYNFPNNLKPLPDHPKIPPDPAQKNP